MTDEKVVDSELGELEAVEQKIEQQEPQSEQAKPSYSLPKKLEGKSAEEIAKMYEEAEKKASRLGNEVHEVRKLADELLKSQLESAKKEEKPVKPDFFEDPDQAIDYAIANNPRVKAAEQYAIQVQREQNLQKLVQKHPDQNEIGKDPEFQTWVKQSPVRTRLLNDVYTNWDVDAADELLSTWKALNNNVKRDNSIETMARDNSLRAAAVSTGGTGEGSKKKLSRMKLMELRIRDPERYYAMSSEIEAAYAEGRIGP